MTRRTCNTSSLLCSDPSITSCVTKAAGWAALSPPLWPPLLLPPHMHTDASLAGLAPLLHSSGPRHLFFPSYLYSLLSVSGLCWHIYCLLTKAVSYFPLQRYTPTHVPCCPSIFISFITFLIHYAFFLLIWLTVCLSSVSVAGRGLTFVWVLPALCPTQNSAWHIVDVHKYVLTKSLEGLGMVGRERSTCQASPKPEVFP